jgi:hypothetical protein
MGITRQSQKAPTTQRLSGDPSPADWESLTGKCQMSTALLLDIYK